MVSVVDGSVKKWETTHRCVLPFKQVEERLERGG